LIYFANFEPVYGGVKILEIYEPVFDKSISKDSKFFFEEVERCSKEQNGLLSITGVARRAIKTDEHYKDSKLSTLRVRLSTVAKEQFGDYYCPLDAGSEDMSCGPKGSRQRMWAIKVSDWNEYRDLTEEEEQIWLTLLELWNCSKTGDQVQMETVAYDQLKNKEISAELYCTIIDKLYGENFFHDVVQRFRIETGKTIVLISRYKIGNFKGMHFEE
jgi:hypothetical protein